MPKYNPNYRKPLSVPFEEWLEKAEYASSMRDLVSNHLKLSRSGARRIWDDKFTAEERRQIEDLLPNGNRNEGGWAAGGTRRSNYVRRTQEGLPDLLWDFLRQRKNKDGVLLAEAADKFDVSPRRVRDAMEELAEEDSHVYQMGDIISAYVISGAEQRVSVDTQPSDVEYIGIVSDTHFGSKMQQPTLLYEFMSRAAEEYDLACWLHAGDLTDGVPNVYAGHLHEVWITKADEQVEYAARKYPDTGVPTYAIGGNHDESADKKVGYNVIKGMANRREDFHYIDFYGGYVDVAGLSFYLWHPSGGSSYAKSYKLQRFVEGFSDSDKPDVVLAGHLHQYVHVWHRGVHAFLVPSFQATTRFIRRLGYESMCGGMVLEITRNEAGLPIDVVTRVSRFQPVLNDFSF